MVEQELGFRNSNFTVFLNSCTAISGCVESGPCHPGTHYSDPQGNNVIRQRKNSNNTRIFTMELEHF